MEAKLFQRVEGILKKGDPAPLLLLFSDFPVEEVDLEKLRAHFEALDLVYSVKELEGRRYHHFSVATNLFRLTFELHDLLRTSCNFTGQSFSLLKFSYPSVEENIAIAQERMERLGIKCSLEGNFIYIYKKDSYTLEMEKEISELKK